MLSVPRSALAELRRKAGIAPAFIRDCHPKQRAFIEDKSPRKAVCGGRRGGKSFGLGSWFDERALTTPEKRSVYVSLTRGKAYEILGPALRHNARKYGLGGDFKTIQGSLNWVYPNGHRLWLVGCDDKSEVEKLRGEKFVRAAVDECQSMGPFLKSLVEDAIEPALVDERGDLALVGSPGIICAGYFYEATNGSEHMVQWPTHHWTMLDNPFIPHAREVLEETKRRNKWGDDHPTLLREWLGQWVSDANQLVYPLERERNAYDGRLPEGTYSYCLGVDIGFTAATALCVVALRRPQQELYVIESETRAGLTPLGVCAWVRETRQRYQAKGIQLPCVVDEGGLGAGYAEQMREMGVGCEAAEKTGKRAAQEWLRGRFIAGTAKVDYLKAAAFVGEAARLAFDEKGEEEAEGLPNHACDGVLYPSRFLCPSMGAEPPPPGPVVGSQEWEEQRMRKEKEDRAREVERRHLNTRGRRR